MLAACLLLALSAQDAPPEVSREIGRLRAKDPRTAFDALSRLADLAATSRAAVQAAAAKLPDELSFYRSALEEELRARERLGEKYPKVKRASIDAKDQTALAVLNEMSGKFSDKIDLTNYTRPGAPPVGAASITLKLDEVSFTEALEAVARQSKAGLYWNGTRLMLNPFQEAVGVFSYRNYFAFMSSATRSRKIEFGAGESRSLRYSVSLFWDSDATIARVVKVRVVEAIDGNGKAVAPVPEEPPPPESPRKEGDPVGTLVSRFNQWEIALTMPETEKLARLRGFYEVEVPGAVNVFEFTDLEKDQKKSDDSFELETVRSSANPRLLLRIKAKGSIDELIKMPLELTGTLADGMEVPMYTSGRLSEGRLEFPLVETSRQFGQPQALKSIRLRAFRSLVARRIPFEFADLPAK